jgi:hypothetical protein
MNELEDIYINIGTEKSSFFVVNSKHLMTILERHPLLYYAVEEGVICAQKGYYAGGILAFAQLTNLFNERTPAERHLVAHNFLDSPPSRQNYDRVVKEFKNIAQKVRDKELKKIGDKVEYNQGLLARWYALTKPPSVETDAE